MPAIYSRFAKLKKSLFFQRVLGVSLLYIYCLTIYFAVRAAHPPAWPLDPFQKLAEFFLMLAGGILSLSVVFFLLSLKVKNQLLIYIPLRLSGLIPAGMSGPFNAYWAKAKRQPIKFQQRSA